MISFQSIEDLTGIKRQGHHRIEMNVIHLWGIDLDGAPRCLDRCSRWLDNEEQHRAARLIREKDRQHYVLAHGGLRAVLGRYLDIDPGVVSMCRSEAGKPSLAKMVGDQPTITFNMSHAHGRALIAVSKGQDVGVDLERIRSDVEVTKLSERYFAPSEHATIMRLAEKQRAERFFRYWVAKEAVLKAQGIGLRELSQCEILMLADGIDAEVRVPAGFPLQDKWRIGFLSCGEGWEAAVAAQGMAWVVRDARDG